MGLWDVSTKGKAIAFSNELGESIFSLDKMLQFALENQVWRKAGFGDDVVGWWETYIGEYRIQGGKLRQAWFKLLVASAEEYGYADETSGLSGGQSVAEIARMLGYSEGFGTWSLKAKSYTVPAKKLGEEVSSDFQRAIAEEGITASEALARAIRWYVAVTPRTRSKFATPEIEHAESTAS